MDRFLAPFSGLPANRYRKLVGVSRIFDSGFCRYTLPLTDMFYVAVSCDWSVVLALSCDWSVVLVTGSIALSATSQYISYSEDDFEVLRAPRGRHVAPMGVKFDTQESTPPCQILPPLVQR